MDKHTKALELDKILEMVAEECSSQDGAQLARELEPVHTAAEAQWLLGETDAAFVAMAKYGAPSFYGMKNVTNPLRRAQAGGGLGLRELLDIGATLRTIRGLTQWWSKSESVRTALTGRFQVLAPNKYLEEKIFTCIVSEEEVADNASPALASIRRKIRAASQRVRDQLDKLIHSQAHQKHLQESIVTQRGGRYVVPVKAEFRGEVPGLVHDTSASGATVFIEPMSVVELNNEIRVLRSDEQEEISRILLELSGEAGSFADSIIESYHYAVELDLIFAKAQVAYKMKAVVPQVGEDGKIALHAARHPLIAKEKVVPTDITLGVEFDTLIITGPNTGGKTVALKTIGLLTLMAMCGLMIPAGEGSRVAVFRHILADIGDEQSIEQSLSTFSSHMTNVVSFLKSADQDSLVLFDELGAGTDPTEGAALAIAILSHLHEQGIRTMATTHYSELKIYALSTPGVENACCEFDVETLRPTYRLLIGVPGKSNAFAISSKLGLPDFIIDKAKEQISEQDESFEDVLTSLEQSRVTIENERAEIARYKEQVEELKKSLQEKEEKLDERKERILREANEQAHAILRDTKEYADQTMKLFHKFQKDHVDTASVEKERQNLKKRMSKAENGMSSRQQKQKPKKQLKPSDLSLGDTVKVLSLNLKGTVSSHPDSKGYLFVQMGIIRSKVHISDLELVDEPVITTPSMQRTGAGKIRMSKAASISTEINLLGKTVDEAVAELDKYLDDAYIAHMKSVRIVHGKGTGALRKGVHNYLKRQKHVASFRLGEFGEGDAGVTIVEFKK